MFHTYELGLLGVSHWSKHGMFKNFGMEPKCHEYEIFAWVSTAVDYNSLLCFSLVTCKQHKLTKISGSAHNGFSERFFSNDSCKAKVAELCLGHATLGCEKDILWFEVTVDNVPLVQVLQGY